MNKQNGGTRVGLLLLMALCLHLAARGQTSWQYEYWFDNADYDTHRTGTGSGSSFRIAADVDALSEGLHTINLQAFGASNAITGFTKARNEAYSQAVSQQLSETYGLPMEVEIEDVQVTTERQNLYSAPLTRYFVKAAQTSTARCWFDNDETTLLQGVTTGAPVMLDATGIRDGFHWLNVQLVGPDGGVSAARVYPFLKIPQVVGVSQLTCLCMIDDQLYRQEQVTNNGGVVAWQVDVASLPQGFHRIFVQVVTPSGAASTLYKGFFCRETTGAEFGEMKCVYAIDGGNFDNVAGTLSGGTFHFDLDVTALSDGLHRIAYMLSNGKGVTTKVQTQFFTKIPLGGYGTVEYWYWLNDDDQGDDVMKVKVDPKQNPFSLVQMLTLVEKPIRSSKFAFGFKDGAPTIFAKNDLHMRFYDASGRFVDLNREYVDERVSATVDFSSFPSQAPRRQRGPRLAPTVTTNSIDVDLAGTNTIKWYRLTANEGENLQFLLDRPATVQLFSPQGDEVYTAQGLDAVTWGGTQATAAGNYYLALHDLADATDGTEVTLQYNVIEKYAVLTQDIAAIGNGGPSTITFTGNGLDALTTVELKQGATTIASTVLGTASTETSVKFDATSAATGDYDIVFHFPGKDVTLEAALAIEEAVAGDVATTADFARQFSVASGNDYTFRLRNTSNMTAYAHPVTILVYAAEATDIESVTADGSVLDGLSVENLPEGFTTARRYTLTRDLRPSTAETLVVNVKTAAAGRILVLVDDAGGESEAVEEMPLNDIFGRSDKDGETTLAEGVEDLYYTILFGNDGTESATTVTIADQLDPQLFDLSTFAPRSITLGDKSVELTGEPSGTVTFSLQPRIYALARVSWSLDAATGALTVGITSLSPETLRPVTDAMDGVLPITSDGSGMGRFSYDISLRSGLTTGTEIPNKARIALDANAAAETPTWLNYTHFLKGDVDRNSKVDTQDAINARKHYLNKQPENFFEKAGDMNGDGVVDTQDAILMVKKYLNKQ